jgi:hypothetical protein
MVWPGLETPSTCGFGGFLANDHHECVSAPSETTLVWFIILLTKLTFFFLSCFFFLQTI